MFIFKRLNLSFAVGMALFTYAGFNSSLSPADEFEIHNLSNETVYVAIYYRSRKNHVAIEGWYTLKPTESKECKNNGNMSFFMLAGGKEVVWPLPKTKTHAVLLSDRFEIVENDNKEILTLKSGPNLRGLTNWNKRTEPLPSSWTRKPFYDAANGRHYELLPEGKVIVK